MQTPEITFALVLKEGGDFGVNDVIRLHNQIKRNCTIPNEIVCLTDSVKISAAIRTVKLIHGWSGWWSKIELFREGIFKTDRVCFFDLDTVITGNIDELCQLSDPFVGLRPWKATERKRKALCSGIMIWDASKYHDLYTKFNFKYCVRKFRGDQDYISKSLALANKYPAWVQKKVPGIYSYKLDTDRKTLPEDAKIVVFHGKPRPCGVCYLPWMQKHWR